MFLFFHLVFLIDTWDILGREMLCSKTVFFLWILSAEL